jgi:hypothetical protein
MASFHNPRLNRRLAALTDAIRRGVEYRQEQRDLAKACATIRAALAEARIEPAGISALRDLDRPVQKLAERGECPKLQQADAAFAAQDPRLSLREANTERWARRAPEFVGKPPPPNFGTSLSDWYAWSLAVRSDQGSDPP